MKLQLHTMIPKYDAILTDSLARGTPCGLNFWHPLLNIILGTGSPS
jgi:hypothetical protein